MTETTNSPTKPQSCESCKGLASRVEELERGLRDIYECGSISYAEITIELLLAGAHAEEKPQDV